MRTAFVMTKEQEAKLVQASKPVPCIMLDGVYPPSNQENANAAWHNLGRELGFDPATAKRITGKASRLFTAERCHAV